MKTFTHGTTPLKVIEESLPHKYHMEWNKRDMMHLLSILNRATDCLEPSGEEDDDVNWCIDVRSTILYTIGIEEI